MGRREEGAGGCKECLLSPFFSPSEMDLSHSLSLSLFFPSTLLSFTPALAVSLCNENLSLIEGAAASWPRAAGLDCDTGYVTVMLIEVADQ